MLLLRIITNTPILRRAAATFVIKTLYLEDAYFLQTYLSYTWLISSLKNNSALKYPSERGQLLQPFGSLSARRVRDNCPRLPSYFHTKLHMCLKKVAIVLQKNRPISRRVVLHPWFWLCRVIGTTRRVQLTEFFLTLRYSCGFVATRYRQPPYCNDVAGSNPG